jgi:ADP-ribose pyrophosphatase YjhB (NUDIX family)
MTSRAASVNLNSLKPTHAGGLVIRESKREPEVLIVRPSDGTRAWVLPKGHIEPGERPEEAAGREVLEETGVVASVNQLLNCVSFRANSEDVRVAFYLMRFEGQQQPKENRTVRWVSLDDAERLLTHSESVQILRTAISVINQQHI